MGLIIRVVLFVYLLIGAYLWWVGGGWSAPTIYENLLTMFYIVALWPFTVGISAVLP